jgi:hypothetical protein
MENEERNQTLLHLYFVPYFRLSGQLSARINLHLWLWIKISGQTDRVRYNGVNKPVACQLRPPQQTEHSPISNRPRTASS